MTDQRRMTDEAFDFLAACHDEDSLSQCNAGWLIAERTKVAELEAENALLRADNDDLKTNWSSVVLLKRAEAAEAKVTELEYERDSAIYCHKTSDEHRSMWQKRGVAAEAKVAELNKENHAYCMILAGCGSVAFANTPESHASVLSELHPDYEHAALHDVHQAIGREIKERARAEAAESECGKLRAQLEAVRGLK